MLRYRLRSPLRWLSAITSSLMLLALAGIIGTPWLLLVIPVVAVLFLFGPPIGVYRHAEAPRPRIGVQLEAFPVEQDSDLIANSARYRLVLVNRSPTAIEDFRIRVVVPSHVAPANTRIRPLAAIKIGAMGVNWFLESVYDATAITFRAGRPGDPGAVQCPPHTRLDLADVVLPLQVSASGTTLDYQVSGGNTKASIGKLRLDPQ